MNRAAFLAGLNCQPQFMERIAAEPFVSLLATQQRMGEIEAESTDVSRSYPVHDGIAIIPVIGTLLSRPISSWWGGAFPNYQSIGDMIVDAVADGHIAGIMLEIDSPGGLAAGCLDLAERIAELRGTKPIYAVVAHRACSAAYAIASGADQIFLSKDGDVGSIGVVAMHIDMSGALEKWGVKATYLYAGDHKIDGAMELPLSEQARKAFMHRIGQSYARICDVVASNRGMSADTVRKTEAAVYRGEEAVTIGLADAIATKQEVFMTLKNKTAPAGASLAAAPANASETDTDEAAQTPAPAETAQMPPTPAAPPAAPAAEQAADPAALAEACASAGLPQLTAPLLKQKATMKQVETRLTEAKGIREAAEKLGLAKMGDMLIAEGLTLESARNVLFAAKAEGDAAVVTDPTVKPGKTPEQQASADRETAIEKANRLAGFTTKA